jgi:hypothetical protein
MTTTAMMTVVATKRMAGLAQQAHQPAEERDYHEHRDRTRYEIAVAFLRSHFSCDCVPTIIITHDAPPAGVREPRAHRPAQPPEIPEMRLRCDRSGDCQEHYVQDTLLYRCFGLGLYPLALTICGLLYATSGPQLVAGVPEIGITLS